MNRMYKNIPELLRYQFPYSTYPIFRSQSCKLLLCTVRVVFVNIGRQSHDTSHFRDFIRKTVDSLLKKGNRKP